ncbi:MAG: STAS/SEC14 domain-containing protein [Phycisphaerae bacterium]|jgi:hypothetical protein
MEWKIDYIEDQGIVTVKTSGVANWDEFKKMCEETLAAGREHETHKFFADHRELEPGLSILEIDEMPKMFRGIGLEGHDRIATLYSPVSESKFKFFQSISNMAFLNFKLFEDEDEAMAWLKTGR